MFSHTAGVPPVPSGSHRYCRAFAGLSCSTKVSVMSLAPVVVVQF